MNKDEVAETKKQLEGMATELGYSREEVETLAGSIAAVISGEPLGKANLAMGLVALYIADADRHKRYAD